MPGSRIEFETLISGTSAALFAAPPGAASYDNRAVMRHAGAGSDFTWQIFPTIGVKMGKTASLEFGF